MGGLFNSQGRNVSKQKVECVFVCIGFVFQA